MPAPTPLRLLALLATTGTALAAADHWILTQIPSIAFARLDPLIAPGAVSGHVHNILGGSSFTQDLLTPDQMTSASCSSSIVGADKSNYWSPLLYYQYPNATFSPVMGQNRIYYYTKQIDVKPFPPGLRMITGTAMTRSANATESLGVMLSCDHGDQTHYLPNATSHPGGCSVISLGIFFPSCGLASGDLDSEDHFSHMAWPQSYDGPDLIDDPNGIVCPASHPIAYPTIFFEANYYLNSQQPWRNDDNVLVLAHGDATGLAYHADFHNGWDQTVLTEAIAECGLGKGPGENLAACSPLAESVSEDNAYACRIEAALPDEEIGLYRPIPALPGCNPLWTAEMPDTKPACIPGPDPEFVGPNVFFENLLYRMHIPLDLPEATIDDILDTLIPGLGDTGASKILPWGQSDGSNDAKVNVGSYAEIMAGLASGVSVPTPTSGGTSSAISSSTTPSTSTSVVSNAGAAFAEATPTGSLNSTASASMCKRRLDGEISRREARPMEQARGHLYRRKRELLGHEHGH